jgi:large subunit ribosomal protein L15
MVLRSKKRYRRYLGTRRWGGGNIKSRRGKGSRGGVGRGGTKHKWSYTVVYEKERIGKTGFKPWQKKTHQEIDLNSVSSKVEEAKGEKPIIELKGFKVLSTGKLSKPAVVKATAFSKKAEEKIKAAGGEAVKF